VLVRVPNSAWSELVGYRERLCAVIRDADAEVERTEDEDSRDELRRTLAQCAASLAARDA
jgi:hypothetical protein